MKNIIDFFSNQQVRTCRELVRRSPERGIYPKNTDTLVGYVYEEDGRYHKSYINGSPESVAKFICASKKEKLITTGNDFVTFIPEVVLHT